ncbi:MAG TPA: hypothetical protein VN818_05635 [Gammaproteobacteria bacterium]|nr:hypothetical protein [Gammaproteobacteria bacterium]
MTKRIVAGTAAMGVLISIATGCAVRPVVDPRNPAPVRDGPVVLTVCYVDGDGAHLAVGDRIELTANKLGRLRIRHLPAANRPAWNGGDDTGVKDDVLVEQIMPRGESKSTRRFVPVGRFSVQLPDSSHVKFDFLASKLVANQTGCSVPLGTDVVMIRGVEDQARHGGHAILE